MAERRPLTAHETLFVVAGFGPATASVTLHGTVDAPVLTRAWQLLARDHPVLRCRIVPSANGFELVLSDMDGPEPIVRTWGTPDFDAEVNAPFGQDGSVSRISLCRTEDGVVLTLAISHAVSDARLLMLLLHRLLDYYTTLLAGDALPPTDRPAFDTPLEPRLLAAYEPARPEPPFDDEPVLLGGESTSEGFAVLGLHYERERTADLVATARRHGLSVSGLLGGVLACAIRAEFPASDGPLPVALGLPVDLRPRLTPPVAADELFCCAGRCVIGTRIGAEDDPVDAGRRLVAQLRAVVERNEPQRALLADRLDPTAPPPAMSFLLSNIGAIDGPRLPPGTVAGRTRLAATLHGPVPALYVATVAGRLTLDLVYDRACHPSARTEDVVRRMDELLANSMKWSKP